VPDVKEMTMAPQKLTVLLLAPIAVVLWARNISGFETDTHTLLSLRATQASQLNTYLTTVLGFEFSQGISEEVGQGEFKKVSELIANIGAVNEDKPDIRSRTHFHDPTKAWAQAGLTGLIGTFQSSILWSQNPNQGSTGKHSWQDARNSYFNGLTATNIADRKKYYAETFESLGHLIHLVQDAATPAHSRNDWHLGLTTGNSVFPFLNVDRFHEWARFPGAAAINAAASQPFDLSILNQTYNGLVPIAGIIDTTTAAGPAMPTDATNIGIAEYSNANFFSDDTILTGYSYPNTMQMQLSQEPGPDGPEPRSYLRKSFGPGPTGYRAAVSTRLLEFLPSNFSTQQLELDDNVMADYGALLFPRAIGYSAGLIDYFFRGQIDAADPPLGYILVPWEERPTSIDVEGVKIIGEVQQTGTGTMRMVLLHENSFLGIGDPPTSPGPKPLVVVSDAVPFTISAEPQNVTFPFASLPFPTIAPPALCCYGNGYMAIIVYRGTLGQELNNAVVASGYCRDAESGETWERFYSFERTPTQAYIGEC
jgi:hypothetical protein